jgi:hypothetical protein
MLILGLENAIFFWGIIPPDWDPLGCGLALGLGNILKFIS